LIPNLRPLLRHSPSPQVIDNTAATATTKETKSKSDFLSLGKLRNATVVISVKDVSEHVCISSDDERENNSHVLMLSFSSQVLITWRRHQSQQVSTDDDVAQHSFDLLVSSRDVLLQLASQNNIYLIACVHSDEEEFAIRESLERSKLFGVLDRRVCCCSVPSVISN
jgi:hypothetical protein